MYFVWLYLFSDVKHKPIDFSPSDRIKTARQIGERKISKVLNPTCSRNRQTIIASVFAFIDIVSKIL